eukprot:TRINITY_DN7547_c0_g1_i1.p1 TRINITY_DN7547_c0_g1~~TRINITY_DN7547_c0_g1_i1.p1  ORF type:complete len:951 (+),score=174.15 TRINITY_DN7547_c0_g1_i1:88-2853(+)
MAVRPCMWLADCLADLAAKPGEPRSYRAVKRIALPTYLWVLLFVGLHFAAAGQHSTPDIGRVGVMMSWALAALGFLFLLLSRISPVTTHSCVQTVGIVGLLLLDLNSAASMDERWWSLCILYLDAALIITCPDLVHHVTIAMVLIYLAVERAEATISFGLYDATYLAMPRPPVPDACACAVPPCRPAVSKAVRTWTLFAFLFVTDYALTRMFAVGLRQQAALVEASVRAAERVAGLLAAYSVREAEQAVAADGEAMPPALRAALQLLLQNLKSYRPYLPDSLLNPDDNSDTGSDATDLGPQAAPPGLGSESDDAEVSLCFTDIESSTALWEAHPQGMYDALQIHNRVVRRTAACHGGYEVKTIGDAFMVAFSTPATACAFGLQMQRLLLTQDWPEDILQHELCMRQTDGGQTVWCGLRVRAGINCGLVRVQRNRLTGRCDYFGQPVNIAARIEGAVQRGGLVGVTTAVLDALGERGLSDLGNPFITSIGSRQLKGLKEAVQVHIMLPAELAVRFEDTASPPASPSIARNSSGLSGLQAADSAFAVSPPSTPPATSLACGPRQAFTRTRSGAQRAAGPRTGAQHALCLRLRKSAGSCCATRCPLRQPHHVEQAVAEHLVALESAADSTSGVVNAVISSCVVVTWNGSRPCVAHAAACAHFLRVAQRDPRGQRRGVSGSPRGVQSRHFGAASGSMMSGNVGGGRHRYATVIGSCVELSAALAEEAEMCGDAALAAGAVADLFADSEHAHRAQLWQPRGCTAFTVWELSLGQPASASGGDRASQTSSLDSADSGRWGQFLDASPAQLDLQPASPRASMPIYGKLDVAFHKAAVLHGEEQLAVLRELCEATPADPRAHLLLERAERGGVRHRMLPASHAQSRTRSTAWRHPDAHRYSLTPPVSSLPPSGGVSAARNRPATPVLPL